MRIEKWGFLLSYAIYLVICVFFSLLSNDECAINSMIFAITVASTAFSIADLLFTKLDIDKKERESMFNLFYISNFAVNLHMEQIKETYSSEAEKLISKLTEIFEGDTAIIARFLMGDLSAEEKSSFLNKVKACSSEELYSFISDISESDNSDIVDIVFEEKKERDNIQKLDRKQQKKEKMKLLLPSCIAVFGLVGLLTILTLRLSVASQINNALTVVAFLSVIISLLLKEYYKASSLRQINQQKNELLKDLRQK